MRNTAESHTRNTIPNRQIRPVNPQRHLVTAIELRTGKAVGPYLLGKVTLRGNLKAKLLKEMRAFCQGKYTSDRRCHVSRTLQESLHKLAAKATALARKGDSQGTHLEEPLAVGAKRARANQPAGFVKGDNEIRIVPAHLLGVAGKNHLELHELVKKPQDLRNVRLPCLTDGWLGRLQGAHCKK